LKKKIIIASTKSLTQNLFLKKLAVFLQKKNYEIILLCRDTENLKIKNCKKIKILFPQSLVDFFDVKNLITEMFKLIKINNELNSPLFLLNTPVASHFTRISLFFSKTNIVYFVHGFRFHSKSKTIRFFFYIILEYILSLKTKKYININKYDYNFTKKKFKKKNILVKGVGLEFKKKNYSNKINFNKNKVSIIGIISAYKKEKGYLDVINLAEEFKKNNEKIKIKAFGYGDRSPFLSIIKQKKLKNIYLYNFNKNIIGEIEKFHILLHLSYREGLPVSVMQALSCGKPVIARKIRGNEDLITNNSNGILFEDFKKEKIYKKIKKLISNKIFYSKMSNNAKLSIDHNYYHDSINNKIYKFIKNV